MTHPKKDTLSLCNALKTLAEDIENLTVDTTYWKEEDLLAKEKETSRQREHTALTMDNKKFKEVLFL